MGSFYKTPSEPVWVVGSTSHFTVLFALDRKPITESRSALLFAAASRAFKQQDTDESGYIPKEKLSEVLKALAPPPTANSAAAAAQTEYFLPSGIAYDAAAVSALTANLEMAGNGIILWTDFWRAVSRLMSGASVEAVLAGHEAQPSPQSAAASSSSGAGASSGASSTSGGGGGGGGGGLNMLAEVSTGTEAMSEDDQIARAIAESMGELPSASSASSSSSASSNSLAMVHPAPAGSSAFTPVSSSASGAPGGSGSSEDDDLARAIAASMGDQGGGDQGGGSAPPSSSSTSSSGGGSSSSTTRLHRADSVANDDGDRIQLFHYNGLTRGDGGGGGGGGGGRGRKARLVQFSVVKRSDEELVGAAVSLNTGGGLGGALMGSDHAVEDVLRTRWQGARIDWGGQQPPSID